MRWMSGFVCAFSCAPLSPVRTNINDHKLLRRRARLHPLCDFPASNPHKNRIQSGGRPPAFFPVRAIAPHPSRKCRSATPTCGHGAVGHCHEPLSTASGITATHRGRPNRVAKGARACRCKSQDPPPPRATPTSMHWRKSTARDDQDHASHDRAFEQKMGELQAAYPPPTAKPPSSTR